jgi:hypothetical protein
MEPLPQHGHSLFSLSGAELLSCFMYEKTSSF